MRCSWQSVSKPPAHSVPEDPCTLVTSTREETFTPGTENNHQLRHSVKARYRVIQPRTPSSSIRTLTCTSMHIINSVRGTVAVKSTLEHYHPIFKHVKLSAAQREKAKQSQAYHPQCSLQVFGYLQGSSADLPGHSRNCHRAPHSHSC